MHHDDGGNEAQPRVRRIDAHDAGTVQEKLESVANDLRLCGRIGRHCIHGGACGPRASASVRIAPGGVHTANAVDNAAELIGNVCPSINAAPLLLLNERHVAPGPPHTRWGPTAPSGRRAPSG